MKPILKHTLHPDEIPPHLAMHIVLQALIVGVLGAILRRSSPSVWVAFLVMICVIFTLWIIVIVRLWVRRWIKDRFAREDARVLKAGDYWLAGNTRKAIRLLKKTRHPKAARMLAAIQAGEDAGQWFLKTQSGRTHQS